MVDKNMVLISSALVCKVEDKKFTWFMVKTNEDGDWEFPKTVVRKVESSVRGAIRMTGEQCGITGRVIEEVGRTGGVTTAHNKVVPQRHIYYLMKLQSASKEAVGFYDSIWLDDAKILRKLSSKKEQLILKEAKKVMKEWEKNKKDEPVEEVEAFEF